MLKEYINTLKTKYSSKEKETEDKEHYVQNLLTINKIIDNVVFLADGTICGILEILPINYYHKSFPDRNKVIRDFERVLKICPDNVHIKIRTEDTDITKLLNFVNEHIKQETDPALRRQMIDYLSHIKKIQGAQTLCQKFYFIYEYTGDSEGKQSNDIESIMTEMENLKHALISRITACGNLVITPPDGFTHVCEILYRHFNPISSVSEPVIARDMRLNHDRNEFNGYLPDSMERAKDISDIVLPRGIDLRHRALNYMVMDGQYHTYLSLKDDRYPLKVYGGWIDTLPKGRGIDYDIILKKIPKQKVLNYMPQLGKFSEAWGIFKKGDREKQQDAYDRARNIYEITTALRKKDQDLWNVMVIITIRSNSYKDMMTKRDQIIKNLKSNSIYVNDSFLTIPQYFRYTMPLITADNNIFSSIFNRDKRNFLTTSAASLYCFTSYELFDENGYVMGTNAENNTLVSINNFNTARYKNGNILLMGTSGAGKTFTETMLGYRMRMAGIRVLYILPVKGYEDHYNSCKNINGSFITLAPSSPNCINIMEIRPTAKIKDKNVVSLLSQKITSVECFIQLLMGNRGVMEIEDENELSEILMKLYADFGITSDNDSIWKDKAHTKLKDMPTLGDLYARLIQRTSMKKIASVLSLTIKGECRSLNGQTNVDLSSKYIVFNVDSDSIKESLYPAFLYLAFDCAYSMAKESDENFDAIFLDEVWKMMINESCAKQVMEMVKLIRAYAGCVVIATQDIEDFIGRTHGFGSAVINNTKLKMLLNMEENEIDLVSKCMKLTPDDRETIQALNHQALLYSNGDKVVCNLIASQRELEAFTTDPNLKKKFRQQREQRARQQKETEQRKRIKARRTNKMRQEDN